jgi:hypothetical protein
MAETSYEFAVFGSTPLAQLLAGLLASAHGKRVCLVGEPQSVYRLVRGIDLSVMLATRPETWALLRDTVPETLGLLKRMGGRSGVRRIDPVFVAETAEGIDALSHAGHVAAAFGHQLRRLEGDCGLAGGVGYRWRGAVLFDRPRLQPALSAWLEAAGVGRLAANQATTMLRRDGSARLETRQATFEADHAVLADDSAILAHLEGAERDRTLLVQNVTAVLTEPGQPLMSTTMVYPDRLVTLVRNRSGSISALGAGGAHEAAARIGTCLASQEQLRRAGQASFRQLATVDGAPLLGQAKGVRATVIAGLGSAGAFLAPAIARVIAKAGDGPERAYFAAREGGRGSARATVADYQSPLVLEAQF